MLKGKSNN